MNMVLIYWKAQCFHKYIQLIGLLAVLKNYPMMKRDLALLIACLYLEKDKVIQNFTKN